MRAILAGFLFGVALFVSVAEPTASAQSENQPAATPVPTPTPTPTATPAAKPVAKPEQVTVTAYRTPIADLASPANTHVLTTTDLEEAPSISLDGKLRQVAGVDTFRRSSSLVANPAAEGLSLRGLGSTSASRTLMTLDDVPLNDAFAGWIHWEELPELDISSIELVRGGASDLYGSSAIGGVVNILPVHPEGDSLVYKESYGSEYTYDDALLGSLKRGAWGLLATGSTLGTNGFIQEAPGQRGLIDKPSNVHAENGLVLAERERGGLRLFVRASLFNEARNNGTLIQKNGTRLWRYASGADRATSGGGAVTLRVYGSTTHYRQTFSSIAPDRNSETLNRFALTPSDELGAAAHLSQPLGAGLVMLAGADVHDVRAADREVVIKKGQQSLVNLSDRQRQTGVYGELLWMHRGWTVSGSAREDWFSNFDGQRLQPTVAALPVVSEHPFDPRLGVARRLGQHYALSATAFRAYRAPTPNELYRATQVGNLLTLANNSLRSERATGWETGLAMDHGWGTMRLSYFWTQVNRPITALTTNPNSSPILLQRENLGQIESRGLSLDYQWQPVKSVTVTGGYQYADATVTKNPAAPTLVGNWIPQVAHNMATASVRGYRPRLGTLSLDSRLGGRQFDDDENTYLLHGYFRLDAYASRDFGSRWQLFVAGENLLDRAIEVGRTPTLTLATPRTVRAGLQVALGRNRR